MSLRECAVLVILGVALAVCGGAVVHAAQPPSSSTAFDVASVKTNISGVGRPVLAQRGPGTFFAQNSTVRNLIRGAYGVYGFQVLDGPRWIDVDKFDIIAKLPSPAASGVDEWPRVELALQALLADRFALKTHTELRPLAQLVVRQAKGGMKLVHKEASCISLDADSQASLANTLGYCGTLRNNRDGSPATIQGGAVHMSDLVAVLSSVTGQLVRDETGVKDMFDVDLRWATDDAGGGLFTALREQLGLAVESDKRPAQVIIVNHVEHPTED